MINKRKKFILSVLVVCILLVPIYFFSLSVRVVKAQDMWTLSSNANSGFTNPNSIPIDDSKGLGATLLDTAKNVAIAAKDWAIKEWEYLRDEGIALAYKKALGYFLNQMAYDMATYLVTGDKGQSPMFYTESWGDYLRNVGDNALGHFLEELGQGGPVKFDLCDPGLDVTMMIGIGIMQTRDPREPDCTFSEMRRNWEAELQRKDFLRRFVHIFNPQENDFGISLSLQSKLMEREALEKENAQLVRTVNKGFKDVTEPISKAIKTPAEVVRQYTDKVVKETDNQYFQYTGHALADAIDVFTNTLIGKLIEEWLRKGMARSFDDTTYQGDYGGFGGGSGFGGGGTVGMLAGGSGLSNFEASGSSGGDGISQAKKQFKDLIAPDFSVRGDYDAMNKLVTCTDPVNSAPDECVITEDFRQAIENKMTIGQALRDEHLSANGVFGFRADGLEPPYNEAYPYRSLIILRKFRIIPIGWELAAQYIMDHRSEVGTLNLKDMLDCFDPSNDMNDRYPGYQGLLSDGTSWCEGLVDPNWVLKSPQNFCKREGPGPHIISEQVTGQGDDSEYILSRSTNYCADEQTCIKENNNGSCDLYGYCTEDRRKYNFGGEECRPLYNSCQSFRAEDGHTGAYLEDTLNYYSCSADNAGCRMYRETISYDDGDNYNAQTDEIDWATSTGFKHLDAVAEKCEESSEGCSEFIRVNQGMGANLLPNPSFEEIAMGEADDGQDDEFGYWGVVGGAVSESADRMYGLELSNDLNQTIVINNPDGNLGFDLAGQMLVLSLYTRDCAAGATINLETESVSLEADAWSFIYLSYSYPDGVVAGDTISFGTTGAVGCIIDALKLERVNPGSEGVPTNFSRYREIGLSYQKLIPNYLYNSCYDDVDGDGFIEDLSDAPEVCADYVRTCTAMELDCELYTDSDAFTVPARVMAQDYCPADCVGYDAYQQSDTNFEDLQYPVYLIPDTADECDAFAAGCDEFTNLDETIESEQKDYYLHLRNCIEPDNPLANCAPYFTWEGNDETGYQLRIIQLDSAGGAPRTVVGPSGCSVDIVNTNYDPECREFYDAGGNVHIELYYNTFSCSEDCHPYRRTIMDDLVTEQTNCLAHGGDWNAGGYCVYMGIPGEGITCDDSQAGCREYNGNAGANTRILFQHDFEDGTNMGWNGGTISNTAVIVGEHSLSVGGVASFTLGSNVGLNRSYVLELLVFSASAGTPILDVLFDNGNGDTASFFDVVAPPILPAGWQAVEFFLDSLDHEVNLLDELLTINAAAGTFLDNVRLTEVGDRHYLVKNSWHDDCEYENADSASALWPDVGHYAGCESYSDRSGQIHNLFQFNQLCPESAVGCELVIDTHNYSDYNEGFWFENTVDEVAVPADSYSFVVYDSEKQCTAEEKGCERMGREYYYEYESETNNQYFDDYLLDNPDVYNQALCTASSTLCDAWEERSGFSYFKNPQDMVCEWRTMQGLGIGRFDWFKKKVKRCDGNLDGFINTEINMFSGFLEPIVGERNICESAADCALMADPILYLATSSALTATTTFYCENNEECSGGACVDNACRVACVLDEQDYPCQKDNNYGRGTSTIIIIGTSTPYIGTATLPILGTNTPPKTTGFGGLGNRIQQPLGAIEDSDWVGACPAGQGGCSEYLDPESQFSFEVDTLKPFTAYIAESEIPDCAVGFTYVLRTASGTDLISGEEDFFENQYVSSDPSIGDIFYYHNTVPCRFNTYDYTIKRTVVDYQLRHTLDKTSCNGIVDFEEGCVLLNERSVSGESGFANLIYNASSSLYRVPTSPQIAPPPLNSNTLLKVSPDRVCNTWLSCRSFIKDSEDNDVCFDVGLCERLDENGNCSFFVSRNSTAENQIYASPSGLPIDNMTGYVKASYEANRSLRADQFPIGDMTQVGQKSIVPNGSFELYDAELYPLGWFPGDGDIWERDMFRVINNPVSAQIEGIDYPIDGSSFLKAGGASIVRSEQIELAPNTEYNLTMRINTKNLPSGGVTISFGGVAPPIVVDNSLDWQLRMTHFNSGGSEQMRMMMSASVGLSTVGNFYVDDIIISPVLYSRDEGNSPWYVRQSCRLYPEADSLSCDYYDSSGHRKKGWLGYCLEYDRYPGNPDACLMWYPIDRANGEGIEEGGGYIDRQPLYYCIDDTEYEYGLVYGTYDIPRFPEPSYISHCNQNLSEFDMDIPCEEPPPIDPAEDPTLPPATNVSAIYGTYHTLYSEDMVVENNIGAQSSGDIDITHRNPVNQFAEDTWTLRQLGLGDIDKRWLEWENISHIRITQTNPSIICSDIIQPAHTTYFRFTENYRGEPCPTWMPYGSDCSVPSSGIEILTATSSSGIEHISGIRTTRFDRPCDHPDRTIREIIIFPRIFYCSSVANVVTPMGNSKFYSGNVYEGSPLTFACNAGIPYADTYVCDYMSDLAPFGAIAEPGLESGQWSIMSNPYSWDSKEKPGGNQPLYYEFPNSSRFRSAQARMGQLWNQNTIADNLFAQSYGIWHWSGHQYAGEYSYGGEGWHNSSVGTTQVQSASTTPGGTAYVNQLVNLRFYSDVDRDHLPLTMFRVDWGDGNITSVSGIEMRDRPESLSGENEPHSLYHIYSEPGQMTIVVTIRDNWGGQAERTFANYIEILPVD